MISLDKIRAAGHSLFLQDICRSLVKRKLFTAGTESCAIAFTYAILQIFTKLHNTWENSLQHVISVDVAQHV
jgi:hypothetical protein